MVSARRRLMRGSVARASCGVVVMTESMARSAPGCLGRG
jgi:hypothetical protein